MQMLLVYMHAVSSVQCSVRAMFMPLAMPMLLQAGDCVGDGPPMGADLAWVPACCLQHTSLRHAQVNVHVQTHACAG